MISVDGLTVEFGDRALFKDISFQINEKDRIALMGKNGAGKSTLLKILAGQRKPSRGSVSAPKDTVIAYLPQHLMTEDGRTVYEEASQAFAPLFAMEKRIDDLNRQLTERTDYDSPEYYKLIEEVSALSEKYYSIDLTHFEADVEKTLLGLGFKREDLQRQTSDFSGGWRMRIELAKMLLKNPDVLLLDEPTNHLDIDSIQWLEEFLISNGKAVVVISHDRTFVDNITTRTIEVTMGRIYDYKVNYSKYLELRKDRRAQQQKAYDEQQKMIAETKDFIERFKGTYSKTLQVQSRVKMLEKAGMDIKGQTIAISGFGNVAWGAATKATELGAKVVTISGPDGYIYDPAGLDAEKIAYMLELRASNNDVVEPYAKKFPGSQFFAGKKPWEVKVDIAMPCATQNELDGEDAKRLLANGVKVVAEVSNMGCRPEAIDAFIAAKIPYGPGKAVNAGGVATSGLEMTQNSQKLNWTAEEVDAKLHQIMSSIHHACVEYGTEKDGYLNYMKGANIAGFMKVAKSMVEQGVI